MLDSVYTRGILTGVMARKKQPRPQMNWRPTAEDEKLMAELKAKLGIMTESDVLRLGLRALAQKEGLAA